jgi:amidase
MTTTTSLRTAQEIAGAVRAGSVSAVDVVREHLARIDAQDLRLGAFRAVRRDTALAEAAAIDARGDRSELPLAGVPVAVKDNIAVAGEQVRHGSNGTDPRPARCDDEVVSRLRRAGAVVIGITRMPELAAWAFTSSVAFGITRNPWNTDLDPGGSTGGGAVAVATRMAALAVGTDGGGSLRVPAAYCGVVGVKPGRGVVPLPGSRDEHWFGLSVAGPIARTAADAAVCLAVLRGERPVDLVAPANPLRVAVSLRCPVPTSKADAHQRAAVEEAVNRLGTFGHDLVCANPPYPPTLIQRWSRRWWAGIAVEAEQLKVDPEQLEPRTRTMIRKGRRVLRFGPRPAVAAAWREKATRWLSDYDLLITPVAATGPADAGAFNGRGYLPTFLAAGRSVPFCQAWNLAGLPALSVPVGIRDGFPMAAQVIGMPGSEPLLLAVAEQIENIRNAVLA